MFEHLEIVRWHKRSSPELVDAVACAWAYFHDLRLMPDDEQNRLKLD